MSSSDRQADRAQLAAKERELAALRSEVAAWRARFGKLPMRDDTDFTSVSGRAVEPVYTPLDLSPDLLAHVLRCCMLHTDIRRVCRRWYDCYVKVPLPPVLS